MNSAVINSEVTSKQTKRQLRRIDSLMPSGIPRWIRCYDEGPNAYDRYTVVYTGRYAKGTGADRRYQYVCMSEMPFSPCGLGQHGSSEHIIDTTRDGLVGFKWPPAIGQKGFLGTRIQFSDLPIDCQKLVISDYRELWGL